MSPETEVDLLLVGRSLESLGASVSRGELPDPKEIISAASSILLLLADVDELKASLNAADAARVDRFVEIDAEAKLGPRPQ